MSQYNIYQKEIYDFLNTVTIKFDELGKLLNQELQYDYHDIDLDDRTTWPYYINMVGEYHESNIPMEIISSDTDEKILFSKENLNNHPITKSIYSVHNREYNLLCETYPNQTDLIKSIRYPVKDIDKAISSPDFTLLSYDESYLDPNEKYDILEKLSSFLQITVRRWYVDNFYYEELAPIAFWAIVIYQLPLYISVSRLENLHTQKAHTFHIWEYLKSKGLGNYKDILTNEQTMFLYRNIKYIYANRGKEETLGILASNILKKLRVSLVGKNIYRNNETTLTEGMWSSEIISEDLSRNIEDRDNFETISNLTNRLYANDLDDSFDIDHVIAVEDKVSTSPKDKLQTKFVELKKFVIDNKYENILLRYLLENLVLRISNNTLSFTTDIYHESTNITIEDMYVKDALILANYCIAKSIDIDPIPIPNKYTLSTSYIHQDKPDDLPKYFNYKGQRFRLSDFINVKGIINSIYYKPNNISSFEDFGNYVALQFPNIVRDIRFVRHSGCKMTHLAMTKLYEYLIPTREITFSLSPYITYAEWIYNNEEIESLIRNINVYDNKKELYFELYSFIIDKILPISHNGFFKYLSLDNSTESNHIYKHLKDLFIQLCSYNITFLDTERDSTTYFILSSFPIDIQGESKHKDGFNIHIDKHTNKLKTKLIDSLKIEPANTSVFLDNISLLTDIKVTPQTDIIIEDYNRNNIDIYLANKEDIIKDSHTRHDIDVNMGFDTIIGLDE